MIFKILGVLVLSMNISYADQYVSGHYKSNGTYVNGYTRSSPNNTVSDNYSTKGNTNPYTGTPGTKIDHSYGSSPSNSFNSNQNSGSGSLYAPSGRYRGK